METLVCFLAPSWYKSYRWETSLDWFTPLTPSQDVCTALMITAYASLSWKDTLSCQRTTTQLCWPLLKQVRTGGRYGYILAELGEETECSESEKRGCFTAGYLLP